MALNLSKIKSEAREDKEREILEIQNQKKILEGVIKHREDLKNWFISLFPDEKIENNGYMEIFVPFDGGTNVSLIFQLVAKSPNGNMVQANNKVNFLFQKTKNGNVVASTAFVDETDYLNLNHESKDYKYTYTVGQEKRIYTFSELEQFVQYVIDK